MTENAIQALRTIASFPITNPKNMDAVNIRNIAVSALAELKKEVPEKESEFNTEIEKGVQKCILDTIGFENPSVVHMDDNLFETLDMDDIDIIELHMRLEETFSHEISDEDRERFKTVRDIVSFIASKE